MARRPATTVTSAQFTALSGVPFVKPGDDLIAIVRGALAKSKAELADGDIIVIAQKIISKAEGRSVSLETIAPSETAKTLASIVNKDPKLVELILRESNEVVRSRRDILIVAQKLGLVVANAGIDFSNVDQQSGEGVALLLPEDPDKSSLQLRQGLKDAFGVDVGVLIIDSHGRPFRRGTIGTAIGVSGVRAVSDLRGQPDLFQRALQSTEIGTADEVAAAASLLMGQAGEGRPIVLVRGLANLCGEGQASDIIRPERLDLFRAPLREDASTMLRLLGERRSVHRYTDEPVPDSLIKEILTTAIHAPSAHNRQPWRFAILGDTASKACLAQAMGERLRADRSRDGDAPETIERDVANSRARIQGAPVCIVVCLTMEDMDVYPDDRRSRAERLMAVQGTAMATQNLLLAAHATGLGASIMCAPLFCPEIVVDVLDLPAQWEPCGLVTLGYPATPPKPFKRRPLSDVIVRVVREKT